MRDIDAAILYCSHLVTRMKATLQLQFALFFIAGLLLLGCSTPHMHVMEKPSSPGRQVEASPDLERFLISHGFHHEESQIYARQYRTLREAGQDLGISLLNLPIPPNAPAAEFGAEDVRQFLLHDWGFCVSSEKGQRLDGPDVPCRVSTSLVQVE